MVHHAVALPVSEDGREVLLACHTEGTNYGALLPPSGKVKPTDRNAQAAAVRETREELGIDLDDPRCVGVVEVLKEDGDWLRLFVFVSRYRGKPRKSNEMRDARLFPIDDLPLEDMWPDASSWVPHVINHGHDAPPLGFRLRHVRGPNGRPGFLVKRFNPAALVRRYCA
ncbi:MAG: NUDIX domain-containing protein [Patescibacteria group bacterium]|jgi:8-oxo-dGTP diphosphatase